MNIVNAPGAVVVLLASVVFTLLLLLASSCDASADGQQQQQQQAEPFDEDAYRPVIRCVVCEGMVKRYIKKMQKTPFSSPVPFGKEKNDKEAKRRLRTSAAAWATELLADLCKGETGRNRMYCDEALESCEDHLVKLGTSGQTDKKDTLHSMDLNATSESICAEAKHCTIRGEIKDSMKNQIESAQTNAREEFSRKNPLWKLVLREMQKNAMNYLALFFTTLAVITTLMFFCMRRKKR